MMTETGYVEEAPLEWLAGKDDDPNDHGLGWTCRSEDDMEVCVRDLTDPIVEALRILREWQRAIEKGRLFLIAPFAG